MDKPDQFYKNLTPYIFILLAFASTSAIAAMDVFLKIEIIDVSGPGEDNIPPKEPSNLTVKSKASEYTEGKLKGKTLLLRNNKGKVVKAINGTFRFSCQR